MPIPKIDAERCNGCGECLKICPMDVFEMKDGKSVAVRADDCIGCRACEAHCPEKAIIVTD